MIEDDGKFIFYVKIDSLVVVSCFTILQRNFSLEMYSFIPAKQRPFPCSVNAQSIFRILQLYNLIDRFCTKVDFSLLESERIKLILVVVVVLFLWVSGSELVSV